MPIAMTLGLQALQYVLGVIGQLKNDHALTDDAVNAEALKVCGDNDAAYQQLKAALSGLPVSNT